MPNLFDQLLAGEQLFGMLNKQREQVEDLWLDVQRMSIEAQLETFSIQFEFVEQKAQWLWSSR
ncbi:MAG: hypothetical protein ABW152_12530 [Candidatus Thiodiazotropha endolucinida]